MLIKRVIFVSKKLYILIFLILIISSNIHPGTAINVLEYPDFEYTILDNDNHGRVAIGDIDGDGKNDVAVHTWHKDISWYKYPDWEKTVIASKDDIRGDDIVLVDLDKDGDLDVLCSYDNNGKNIWWFENPSPSEDPKSENWKGYMIGTGHIEIKDIYAVDFDNDGVLDVVARYHDRVHIYFQNNLNYWTQKVISVWEREGMDVGDIDRDGDIDIVLNGFWLENPNDPRNDNWPQYSIDVLWYQQNEGIWRDNACKVKVYDINQDGRLDVVFSHSEKTGYPVAWYDATDPRAGDNAWTQHIIGYVDNCHTLQVADIDKDGDPDVVAGRLRDSPYLPLYIFYNKWRGNIWDRIQIYEGGCYSGEVRDIDNDGDLDFVSSQTWKTAPLYILRNSAKELPIGPWERHIIDLNKPWRSIFIITDDVNHDGFSDIITGGWWYENPGTPEGIWTRNNIGDPLKNVAAVFDFDGDGDLDILGTEGQGSDSNDSFVWARNNGEGSFTILNNIQNGDGDFLQGVAVARFNIGRQFEVALSWHQHNKGVQMLGVPTNPSSGTWTLQKIHYDSQDEQLSAGDVDRDGDIDLLQGTKWLRNDDGSWVQFTLNEAVGSPDRNRLADINGDGRLDAVIGFEAISILGKLAWYEQPISSSTDLWTEHIISTNVVGPMSLDVADIDVDGDLDVLVGEHNLDNPHSAKLFVFENIDGTGLSWNKHLVYEGDEHHDGVQVVDIENDGDLDIISIGWSHNRVVLYENKANKGYGQMRLQASLIGWWKLDENTGTTTADVVGSHDGTLYNGPEWRPADGKIGGALAFDGFDDYVDLGTVDIKGGSGLTIAFWFKADDFDTPEARFISKATGVQDQDHYWMVSTIDETALRFRLKIDGETHVLKSGTEQIQAGKWHHVVATYDGNKMCLYKNAVEIANIDIAGSIDTNASVLVSLGNQPAGAGKPFDGLIDDVRIYNCAFNATEILNLMKGELKTTYIDGSYFSDDRCDVSSEQTIGFHAIDSVDGSDLVEGKIHVNEKAYSVNSSGWVTINYSSSNVSSSTFAVTGVGRHSRAFMQWAPNVTIIWDRVKIIEGGASDTIISAGKEAKIWFKAEYEYDSTVFNSSFGVLYVNGSKCTWSNALNRWEVVFNKTSLGINKYNVSGIVDYAYGLKTINDEAGPVVVKVNPNISSRVYQALLLFIIFIMVYKILGRKKR